MGQDKISFLFYCRLTSFFVKIYARNLRLASLRLRETSFKKTCQNNASQDISEAKTDKILPIGVLIVNLILALNNDLSNIDIA